MEGIVPSFPSNCTGNKVYAGEVPPVCVSNFWECPWGIPDHAPLTLIRFHMFSLELLPVYKYGGKGPLCDEKIIDIIMVSGQNDGVWYLFSVLT